MKLESQEDLPSSAVFVATMADWLVGPVMDRIINACSDYLQDQFRWQTGMKEELERLRVNHPKIQAVVSASFTQADISDQNPALNDWIWLLRDAIDEADDLLDELEYMKLKKQLIKNKKRRKVRLAISFLKRTGQRALKIDPYLKRLTEVVQKLDKVSAEVGTFLHLAENAKQQQQKQELELYKTRETGSLPKNDLVGRGKDMEFVMQWLRNPSNEDPTHITLYKNISLLSIVGHGGMGKTALLQHVYQDLKEEFDLKMWVCVSNNFDVKRVIGDMLESLKMKKPDLESLEALQRSLKSEVIAKKFLLVLDDVWEEEQESDKSKWENVFSPLAYGTLGSKILVTTRMDLVVTVIAKLLNIHAFADVENLDNHKQLRSIAREILKTLSGSPLAIKVVGGVLSSGLNERPWKISEELPSRPPYLWKLEIDNVGWKAFNWLLEEELVGKALKEEFEYTSRNDESFQILEHANSANDQVMNLNKEIISSSISENGSSNLESPTLLNDSSELI
ncbi:putative disease resistance protein RGA1, partial [Phalaenopsis equestris]|uniref:putative disease resistance protein RGA1 n=1 Tax=Phalaenopsis equestris TaxID=78828 RepID=UPI0009E23E59